MTWGIPTEWFVQIHVILSLIGMASGVVVLYGLLSGKLFARSTAGFLATTILTSVTGFPLPPPGFDAARAVGTLSLVLLAAATVALYVFHLSSAWRWIFVGSATAALYFNVFVGVVQAFQKLPLLQPLAPTQSEPPFLIAQVAVLAAFILFGIMAGVRFRPASGT
jgi:hypothetical protein